MVLAFAPGPLVWGPFVWPSCMALLGTYLTLRHKEKLHRVLLSCPPGPLGLGPKFLVPTWPPGMGPTWLIWPVAHLAYLAWCLTGLPGLGHNWPTWPWPHLAYLAWGPWVHLT